MFAASPAIIGTLSFIFWFLHSMHKGVSFFAKRDRPNHTTPKDKFVLTICTIVYLLFPTLCTQAFEMFHCRSVAGKMYLAADMEEPCYEGTHANWVVVGVVQLLVYVLGLPVLVLLFLRRNKQMEGGMGLKKHAVIVRYGLFYGAYKEDAYYWETILTMRKVLIVALAVFGPGMGYVFPTCFCLFCRVFCNLTCFFLLLGFLFSTVRQVQAVLAVLLVCISLEIGGDPFHVVDPRYKVLRRLELSTLFVQWATMWCGTMIYASQDPNSKDLVVFLTVVVAIINIGMLMWLVLQLLLECVHEKKEEAANGKGGGPGKIYRVASDMHNSMQRWRFNRMTEEARQSIIRRRTVDATGVTTCQNPVAAVEMSELTTITVADATTGEIKAEDVEDVAPTEMMTNSTLRTRL